MVPNNIICKRIDAAAIMLVLFGLVAGLRADEINLLMPSQPPAATRVLSFPSGQCMGNLYLEPESGPGWDPKGVCLHGEWEYLNAAQGDVRVPEDRNIKLWVHLALSPWESAKMRAQNPQAHQLTIADRTRKDPDDLSGLSELGPNDLFWLSVGTEMYLRTGADPRIFEPISHLTGLRMLSLFTSGITDEGLEHLRSLRSLRGLELWQASISNRGLAVLKDLPALEYLSLNTGLTDADLKQVAQLSNLRWLRIVDGNIWGPGLAELAKLPRLERLCSQSTFRSAHQIPGGPDAAKGPDPLVQWVRYPHRRQPCIYQQAHESGGASLYPYQPEIHPCRYGPLEEAEEPQKGGFCANKVERLCR